MKIDLTGLWVGEYGPHGEEEIEITRKDHQLIATKVTGDPHVPAGKITFHAEILWRQGRGMGQIAERGYCNPQWIPGHLEVIHHDLFVFTWSGLSSVTFRRHSRG